MKGARETSTVTLRNTPNLRRLLHWYFLCDLNGEYGTDYTWWGHGVGAEVPNQDEKEQAALFVVMDLCLHHKFNMYVEKVIEKIGKVDSVHHPWYIWRHQYQRKTSMKNIILLKLDFKDRRPDQFQLGTKIQGPWYDSHRWIWDPSRDRLRFKKNHENHQNKWTMSHKNLAATKIIFQRQEPKRPEERRAKETSGYPDN